MCEKRGGGTKGDFLSEKSGRIFTSPKSPKNIPFYYPKHGIDKMIIECNTFQDLKNQFVYKCNFKQN